MSTLETFFIFILSKWIIDFSFTIYIFDRENKRIILRKENGHTRCQKKKEQRVTTQQLKRLGSIIQFLNDLLIGVPFSNKRQFQRFSLILSTIFSLFQPFWSNKTLFLHLVHNINFVNLCITSFFHYFNLIKWS